MKEPTWERPRMAECWTPLDKYIATITRRQWRAAMRQARREALLEAVEYLADLGRPFSATAVRALANRGKKR